MFEQSYITNPKIQHPGCIFPATPATKADPTPGVASLDTLEQVRKIDPALSKRAKKKYITLGILKPLLHLNSSMRQSYERTLSCGSAIIQKDGKLTSYYCGDRWCLVCNGIRTAKAIKGYHSQLEGLDAYFVTLTTPNVTGAGLRAEISRMQAEFRRIADAMRKRKTPIIGLRKLEVTHSPKHNTFNPHYHLIVDGEDTANTILEEWLKRNPEANIGGQNVTEATEGAMLELLKYSVKMATKGMNPEALDTMFKALKGKRTLQPYGSIKRVCDEVTELDATIETESHQETMYVWSENDWYDMQTGEALSGYTPGPDELEMLSTIKPTKPPGKPLPDPLNIWTRN